MENKRGLRGFKKIATILYASAMMVPLAGCRANNLFNEKDIRFSIDEYISEYENGLVKNGTEMYEYVSNLYSKYEKHANKSFVPSLEPDNTGFVGPTVYGPVDIVKIKTNEEPIFVIHDDYNSYTIHVSNKEKTKNSAYTYNSDGSYSLFVKDEKGILKAKFDKDGLIEALEENNNKEEHAYYEYQNGNMSVYSFYIPEKGIQEKRNEDGSYTLYKYNGRYEDFIYEEYDQLAYNYDKDNNLTTIDAFMKKECEDTSKYITTEYHSTADRMAHTEDIHTIYQPNGDSFSHIKYYDLDGNYLGDKKINEKYKDYIESIENTTVDGKNTTIVSKYDYNVLDSERSFDVFHNEPRKGTTVYEKVNNTVTIQMKDDIIYKYTAEGVTIMEIGEHSKRT